MTPLTALTDDARREERPIITSHVYPPIPDRRFDYCAYRDGDEENASRCGWGPTKELAVNDLLENVDE